MGSCIDCGKALDICPSRLRKNPHRRCLGCYLAEFNGRTKSEGYVRLTIVPGRNGRWQYEHRMVAAKILGRGLRESEVVHHINGDRSDNRPENLRIYENPGDHVLQEGHVGRGRDGKFKSTRVNAKEFRG